MDNLKSLMDKRQYNLVIELTKNSIDINDLFFFFFAFLANGQGKEALSVIENNRKILEGDLSLLMKVHIEILCLLGMFDKAYEEADYYKNLPYQSQQVEEMIALLPKMIREEEKKQYVSKNVSDDEIRKRLLSSDEHVVLPTVDMLRERDLNLFLKEIKKVMVDFPLQAIRSFTLLLCVQKGLNEEIPFNHMGNIINVNPSKLEPPFIGDEFNSFLKYFQSEVKDPVVSENAIQILSSYIIYIYPEALSISYPMLAIALKRIAYDYLRMDDEKSLEEMSIEKDVPLKEVQDLIQRIKDCVDDF